MTRTKFTIRTETPNIETITDFEAYRLADGQIAFMIDQQSLKTMGKKWHRELICVTLTAEQFAAVATLGSLEAA